MDKVAVIQGPKKARKVSRGQTDICREVSSEPRLTEGENAAARAQGVSSSSRAGWTAVSHWASPSASGLPLATCSVTFSEQLLCTRHPARRQWSLPALADELNI